MKKTAILFMVLSLLKYDAALSQVTSYSFTANTGTYASITGSSPALTGNGTDATRDEGYANNIPLGFTFNYLGTDYNSIGASTNGFASFSTITTAGFSNSLLTGGTGRPLLAPFWDDIALAAATDLKYTTTGAAGSRVFILQWANSLIDFGAADISLSFQLRLYETTNRIEFIYLQLPAPIQDYSGGASIGITSGATGSGSFLSLNNTSASPAISSTVATNTIKTKPATGQVYAFMPPACAAPGSLTVTGITTTDATVGWADMGSGSYEYAVSESLTPPVSATATADVSVPVAGLTEGKKYYLHVRRNCGGSFSGWNTMSFATVCDAHDMPYIMPISDVVAPELPLGAIARDENLDGNTWRSYPSAGPGWTDQVVAYVYNNNCTTPANDWLFTCGLNLVAGATYRLRFKYNNDFTALYTEKLKVAYGANTTAAAMTTTLANFPSVSSTSPKTASIDFTPASSGVFYIGFQAYSDANKDVLILDDIRVDLRPNCDPPTALATSIQPTGQSVNISWTAPVIGSPSGYEYVVITSATPPASGAATPAPNAVVNGLTVNTQYYLHVRSNCGGSFSEWTTLAFATLINDEACNAITLTTGGAPACSNTTLATANESDPFSDCSPANNTVWFKYTPSVSGTVVLHLTTPGGPADPLHGWINWYTLQGNCPNIGFTKAGFCAQFGDNGNNDADELISPFLNAGTTYYIMIDGLSDDVGEFCISVPACSPAIAVHIDNIVGTGARIGWTGMGTYILEYGPAGFTPGTGATAGAGGTVINPAVSLQTITGLTLSTTYNVYLRQNCSAASNGYSNNSTVATFTTLGVPPPNDEPAGAVTLNLFTGTCGGATAGTTLNATPTPNIPLPACGGGEEGYDDDVWYKFTPVPDQVFVNISFVSTAGSNDMVAQIYTSSNNTSSGTLSLFACSDDGGGGSMPVFNNIPVSPGTTYFIRLFSYRKAIVSQFNICVSTVVQAAPINDNATGALTLVVGAGCTGAVYTNEGATQSVGEPTGSCSSLTGYSTVWFKFTAPAGGSVRISTATGSGNTLTNSRLALFNAGDVNNYGTFNILACDEDGGAAPYSEMSVLYAAVVSGLTYYIQVDKFDNTYSSGKFCITVDALNSGMISSYSGCGTPVQIPVGNVASYGGWVSLMDQDSKLIALVKNTAGGRVNGYSFAQNIHTGPVRKDPESGEYYLDRNFMITNPTTGNNNVFVQLFFAKSEIDSLKKVDPATDVNRFRITRQAGPGCHPDFFAANGDNFEIPISTAGAQNGVSWVQFTTTAFSNFYIHNIKSRLTAKVFLQGAYSTTLNRHKDVTDTWANVLNTYARTLPYNNINFGYFDGVESVPINFFKATPATTDITDWVFLEIRNSAGTILSRRAAFVREDGQIVDLDGTSTVSFYGLVSGNYSITIRHRNHLGIRSSSLRTFTDVSLGVAPLPCSYDFTSGQAQAYQNPAITTNAAMIQSGSVFMMWAGNANADEYVRVSSLLIPPIPSDPATILGIILGGNPNGTLAGYSVGDLNLDGKTRVTSLLIPSIPSDVAFILGITLNGNPNATRREHR